VYRAKLNKSRVLGGVIARLVELVFGGKPAGVVQALLDEKGTTPEELAEMKRLIEAHSSNR
jgi:predicted transcriptional regulator